VRICAFALAAALLPAPAYAQSTYFAPDAAAKQAVNNALESAHNANRRVILLYDGSWCKLCGGLHQITTSNGELRQTIHSGYELAHVTVEDFDALQSFALKNLRARIDKKNPLLVGVLDYDGRLVTTWTAARLVDGGRISAAKLQAQLVEFMPGAQAEEVFRTALALLPAAKAGFVQFRADWCEWCKKLEGVFGESDASPVLAKYYSVISIDIEKNPGANELAKRLGAPQGVESGIPWFAVVDKQGKVKATSEGPQGNIGYPDTAAERAHFMAVLNSTAGISKSETEKILGALAFKMNAPSSGR
jgi:thiol:disulfide interchange protein